MQEIDKIKDQTDIISSIVIRDLKRAETILNTEFRNSNNGHKKVVGYIFYKWSRRKK